MAEDSIHAGPIDLSESVAGEEDPGASLDVPTRAQDVNDKGGKGAAQPQAVPPTPPMAPGDEAAAGTPGTGEDICRACGGTGMLNGSACPECEGTGKVTVGIGGA